jgi:hypothetical protein
MNENQHDRIKKLLQQAMPPTATDPEPGRDLWPEMLRKLDAEPAAVPWFDWALVGGLLGMVALFPASIPVLLYYL